jgi:acyl carrier protein
VGLDTVELVMAVEEHFKLTIPDDDAATLFTVGMLHEWLVNELHRQDRPNVAPNEVFEELRCLICDQFDIAPNKIVPTARFVQDLGLE